MIVRLVLDDHVGVGDNVLWVTTSGLLQFTPGSRVVDQLRPLLRPLAMSFTLSLQRSLWANEEPLQQSVALSTGRDVPWGLEVFLSFLVGAVAPVQLHAPATRPPWVLINTSVRAVWYTAGPCPRDFRFRLGQWTVEWDDIPGQTDLRGLAHTLKLA